MRHDQRPLSEDHIGIAERPTRLAQSGTVGRWRIERVVIAILCGSLLLRLYGAAVLGLGVDESYALVVSRVPTLSFLDHPPLGFMLARWMADVGGTEAAFWVRLPYLLLFTGSSLLLYILTCRLFSKAAGVWALAWFSVAPFMLISAGSWVVPDGPLIFFLLLSACFLSSLIFEERPSRPMLRWMAVGVAFGLAILSKYQAFLVGGGALTFLLANRMGRRWLVHPGPYVAALIALALFMPVIVWNAEHDWQSLAFQGGRAVADQGFSFADGAVNLLRMLLGQAIYLLPGPFLLAIWLLWRALRTPALRTSFCAALALPPILLFNGVAPFAKGFLPHWSMAGFIFAFPLIGDWMVQLNSRHRRWARQSLIAAGLIVGLVVLVGALQFRSGLITRSILRASPVWDDTTQAMDWFDLERGLRERGWLKPGVVVAARDWLQAAKIDYALGGSVPVIVLKADRRHFAFLQAGADRGAQTVLAIGLAEAGRERLFRDDLVRLAAARFCDLKSEPEIILTRGGLPYRSFVVLSARAKC